MEKEEQLHSFDEYEDFQKEAKRSYGIVDFNYEYSIPINIQDQLEEIWEKELRTADLRFTK